DRQIRVASEHHHAPERVGRVRRRVEGELLDVFGVEPLALADVHVEAHEPRLLARLLGAPRPLLARGAPFPVLVLVGRVAPHRLLVDPGPPELARPARVRVRLRPRLAPLPRLGGALAPLARLARLARLAPFGAPLAARPRRPVRLRAAALARRRL